MISKKHIPHFTSFALAKFKQRVDRAISHIDFVYASQHLDSYDLHYRDNFISLLNICPFCNKKAKYLKTSELVFKVDHGPIYFCDCIRGDALVHCHKHDGVTPMGTLANRNTRKLRNQLHTKFDQLWKGSDEYCVMPEQNIRTGSYIFLAELMGIRDLELCHIGYFNEYQCKKALQLCESGQLHTHILEIGGIAGAITKATASNTKFDFKQEFNKFLDKNTDALVSEYKPPRPKTKRKKR